MAEPADSAAPIAVPIAENPQATFSFAGFELEPVDSVQRNFDAIQAALRSVGLTLSGLDAAVKELASKANAAPDAGDIRWRCNLIEDTQQQLKDRMERLENALGAEDRDGGRDVLGRLAELERRLAASEKEAENAEARRLRAEAEAAATINDLREKIAHLLKPSGETFVTLEQFSAHAADTRVQFRQQKDELSSLRGTQQTHGTLLASVTARVEALEADSPRGAELQAILDALAARTTRTEGRLDEHDTALREANAMIDGVRSQAGLALQRCEEAARAALETREQLTTRLDRLATSTAKSLRAIDAAIAALRKAIAEGLSAVPRDESPLLSKAACLSCNPATAAELRPDALRHRPAAPMSAQTPSARRRSARSPGAKSMTLDDSRNGGISPYSDFA